MQDVSANSPSPAVAKYGLRKSDHEVKNNILLMMVLYRVQMQKKLCA